MDEPFYIDGLKFSCTRCGACCKIADGIVSITERDVGHIAKHLDISKDEFFARYTHREHKSRVLNDFPNGDCIFYRDGSGCVIYLARPEQCRTFPFWRSVIRSRESWEYAASQCPGMNRGKLYSAKEIDRIVKGEQDVENGNIIQENRCDENTIEHI